MIPLRIVDSKQAMSIIPLRVAFLHPDLGLGGAERLVVDAAAGLQSKGHIVRMYTSHCDRGHCFEEIKNGMLHVAVYGDWLPRFLFRRFAAFFAYFRMIYLALVVALFAPRADIYFCDQVSVCVPFLRALTRAKVLETSRISWC